MLKTLSRKKFILVGLNCILLGVIAFIWAETTGINVISNLKGNVKVKKVQWTKPQKASIGMTLTAKDEIEVGTNASAKVYCSNQQLWQVKIGEYLVSQGFPPGKAIIRRSYSNNDTLRPLGKTEEALSKLPYLISPRETYILSDLPRLRWNAVAGVTHYTIKIDGVNWKAQTNTTEMNRIQAGLGKAYRLLGNEGEAVQWLEKAKASYEELGDSSQVQELDREINFMTGRQ